MGIIHSPERFVVGAIVDQEVPGGGETKRTNVDGDIAALRP